MILLAFFPNFLLQMFLPAKSRLRWAYFGKNLKTLQRLQKIFKDRGEQIDYSRQLYEISNRHRVEYVQMLDGLSCQVGDKLEWFASVPAVKNPYNSDSFLTVCYALTARELMQAGIEFDVVMTDSPALGRVIETCSSGKNKFIGWNSVACGAHVLVMFLKNIAKYFLNVFGVCRRWVAAVFVFKGRARIRFKHHKNIILIRNYINDSFSDKDPGLLERHYFPGLRDYLTSKGFEPVFLPVAVGVKSFISLFRRVRDSKIDILFLEEFLGWRDLGRMLLTPLRAFAVKMKSTICGGMDVSPLIREEFYENVCDFQLMWAALFRGFGKNYKESALSLREVINWAEFQSFEKGLIRGIREAFPEISIIGAQPLVMPPHHLSFFPSNQDEACAVLPDKLLVLGPVNWEEMKRYIPEERVAFCPAFRYSEVFSEKKRSVSQATDLLVMFGYGLANALHTMRILLSIQDDLKGYARVMIKLHPAGYFDKTRLLKEINAPLPENFSFVNDRLESLLDKVVIGICGATGTSVELAVRAIPVIQIAETHALTMNYLAFKEDQHLWRLCFDATGTSTALRELRRLTQESSEILCQNADNFRRAYFAQPDEAYWENFLPVTKPRR